MNHTVIVGRLTTDPVLSETENGKSVVNVTVAVTRPFKNSDGVYETDFIPCVLWNKIAQSTAEYCRKGDVVGVRGLLESKTIETKNGDKVNILELVADKITFISNTKEKEINTEEDYEKNIKI